MIVQDGRRGRDTRGVDALHLVGVGKEFAHVAREELELGRVELEICERGYRFDVLACECGGHNRFYNVRMAAIRPAAVAGSWYPGSAQGLTDAVDRYLAGAKGDVAGDLVALVAPHAGLKYSGPVAAHAARLVADRPFDVAVLVAPSAFLRFA